MVTYTKGRPFRRARRPPPIRPQGGTPAGRSLPPEGRLAGRSGGGQQETPRKAPRRPSTGRGVVGEITADPDDGGHPLPRNGCRGAKPPLTPLTW